VDNSIVCVGATTLDVHLRVDKIAGTPESVSYVRQVTRGPGGKGWITASTVARLGHRVELRSLVGRNSRIVPQLAPSLASGMVPCLDHDHEIWIVVDDQHRRVTYTSFGNGDPTALDLTVEELASSPLSAPAVYLAAEHPRLVDAARRAAQRAGSTIVVNLSTAMTGLFRRYDAGLLPPLLESAHILLFNQHEAHAVLRSLDVASWADIPGNNLREVVVTEGADGGRYAQAPFAEWSSFPAIPPRVVRSDIGAGDTFNGAYLASHVIDGEPPDVACRAAAALASRCVEQWEPVV